MHMRTIIVLHLALSEFHNQYLRVVWDREVVRDSHLSQITWLSKQNGHCEVWTPYIMYTIVHNYILLNLFGCKSGQLNVIDRGHSTYMYIYRVENVLTLRVGGKFNRSSCRRKDGMWKWFKMCVLEFLVYYYIWLPAVFNCNDIMVSCLTTLQIRLIVTTFGRLVALILVITRGLIIISLIPLCYSMKACYIGIMS